jgi:hypothetical protein
MKMSEKRLAPFLKKLVFVSCLTILLTFPETNYADSPITFTDFSEAYLDVEIVRKAKSEGVINQEIADYLLSPANSMDIKAAVINALSWKFEGKNNAELYSKFLELWYKKTNQKWNIEKATAGELFCLGYLTAMDDYFHPEKAILFLKRAYQEKKDSFTVSIVLAIAEAQKVMDSDRCQVWELTDRVLKDKELKQDMRADGKKIIIDYMALYKDECKPPSKIEVARSDDPSSSGIKTPELMKSTDIINTTVSGENWDFTVISMENTRKDEWPALGIGETYKAIKEENLCFWRLKIKARYKKPEKGSPEFKSKWVTVVYEKTGNPIATTQEMTGVIPVGASAKDSAIFGEVTVRNTPSKASDPFVMDLLLIAPKRIKDITSMYVEFLDYPKVQIVPLQASSANQKQEFVGTISDVKLVIEEFTPSGVKIAGESLALEEHPGKTFFVKEIDAKRYGLLVLFDEPRPAKPFGEGSSIQGKGWKVKLIVKGMEGKINEYEIVSFIRLN